MSEAVREGCHVRLTPHWKAAGADDASMGLRDHDLRIGAVGVVKKCVPHCKHTEGFACVNVVGPSRL